MEDNNTTRCNNSSCSCQWHMLSMWFDRSEAKPNWLPLTLFLVCQDPLHLSSLSLAQSWLAKCSLAFPAFNATGSNNVMIFWTRQNQIDGLHIQRQRGTVLLDRMLSPVRYIQPLVNWRKIMKHRETKYIFFYMFLFVLFLYFWIYATDSHRRKHTRLPGDVFLEKGRLVMCWLGTTRDCASGT